MEVSILGIFYLGRRSAMECLQLIIKGRYVDALC